MGFPIECSKAEAGRQHRSLPSCRRPTRWWISSSKSTTPPVRPIPLIVGAGPVKFSCTATAMIAGWYCLPCTLSSYERRPATSTQHRRRPANAEETGRTLPVCSTRFGIIGPKAAEPPEKCDIGCANWCRCGRGVTGRYGPGCVAVAQVGRRSPTAHAICSVPIESEIADTGQPFERNHGHYWTRFIAWRVPAATIFPGRINLNFKEPAGTMSHEPPVTSSEPREKESGLVAESSRPVPGAVVLLGNGLGSRYFEDSEHLVEEQRQ